MKREMRNYKKKVVKEQPRKDNKSKRVNFDNERESKFNRNIDNLLSRNDSNDIRWYSKNPQRVQSAARIPFSSIAGVTPAGKRTPTQSVSTPGVMCLEYTPNFVPNQSVIEQAYQNMYSDIVHANSRNSSYDYTDLAIMHMAGTELFSAIALGIRAYGLMTVYQEDNTYTPKAIVKASGFDFSDLQSNFSHMWDDILSLIAQSRQIWIPNTMPIVERRIWMNLNVYKDDQSTKGQYYLYKPASFYQYHGFTDTKGGFISRKPINIEDLKWSNYVTAVQQMIDALIPDQDRGIMYGDILKAYGVDRIFAMNEIGLNYKTVPTYNPEVLWQIENAVVGYSSPSMVVQDSLHLNQTWGWSNSTGSWVPTAATDFASGSSSGLMPYNPMLNFHQAENPTPEQIMIATRMTCCDVKVIPAAGSYDESTGKWDVSTTNKTFAPQVAGTEVVTAIYMYTNTVDMETGSTSLQKDQLTYKKDTSGTTQLYTIKEMYNWAAFDWAPAMYGFMLPTSVPYSTGIKLDYDTPIMEYSNWARISKSELERIHNAAIYSLYSVPTL